jgi:hypothetical protein
MPHLLYLVGRQDVSLFVLEGEARPEATLASLGHRSNVWSVGANTFVLVALAGEGGSTRTTSRGWKGTSGPSSSEPPGRADRYARRALGGRLPLTGTRAGRRPSDGMNAHESRDRHTD